MYCPNCGQRNEDSVNFCPICGTALQNTVFPQVSEKESPTPAHETWWKGPFPAVALLGFFFPLIGLVIGAVYSAKKEKRIPGFQTLFLSVVGLMIGIGLIVAINMKNGLQPIPEENKTEQTTSDVEPISEPPEQMKPIPKVNLKSFKQSAQWIPYDKLYRNTEQYVEKKVVYSGHIFQVMEGEGNECALLISVTKDDYGFWDDNIYVMYERHPGQGRFMVDDLVKVWGIVGGPYTYQSVQSGPLTIPEIIAVDIQSIK